MSDVALVWVQLIVGLFVFAFLAQWLVKSTKNPLFAATLLAVFLWIWTDVGGLAAVEKVGVWGFIKELLLNVFSFGVLWFIAYCFTIPHQKDE